VRFIPCFPTQILRWIAVIVWFAAFAAGQDTAAGKPGYTSQIYTVQLSTGQIISDTFVGARLKGATTIASKGVAGWTLVGVADFGPKGLKGLVHSDDSTGALTVMFYGRSGGTGLPRSSALATPGAGWTAAAVADLNGDGHPDVIFVNKTTGQVDVYFYGGLQGTIWLGRETIGPLSATGWSLVGAADLNADGHPDLILQNPSTRQVLVDYLGGPKGTTVTATEELAGDFAGWTAAGMQDMNGDGHPDLILSNEAGQSMVHYFGGSLGVTSLGASYLDREGSPGWKAVVPSGSANEIETPAITSVRVLIFNGTGTSSTDVAAVESVVSTAGLAYHTVNSSQLDGMTQSQLTAYKLFIVPGGNSITIGDNLTSKATSTVRGAVENGLNYLGMCAGGFFGGYSKYNGVDLTSGVWFDFFADYYKGIHKEAVKISFPSQAALDIYWQNGPELGNWGKIVGKYPNGQSAIVEGYWGSGFVILSGVHPEAPASWRTGMNFTTTLAVDLAYAKTLVMSALKRTMLPHY
jgi:glutamine amidotransferase-like uncharacterized protein